MSRPYWAISGKNCATGQQSTRMPKPPRMVSRPLVNTCFSLLPLSRPKRMMALDIPIDTKGMSRLAYWLKIFDRPRSEISAIAYVRNG